MRPINGRGGRHRRRGPGRAGAHPGAPTRSRPSCRSAPGARSRRWTAPTSASSGPRWSSANTFHLMLRPGVGRSSPRLGGLHRFSVGPVTPSPTRAGSRCTRSDPVVDDDGVTFASMYDGRRSRLLRSPRSRGGRLIGADIQMVLDVCVTLPARAEALRRRSSGRRPGRSGPAAPSTQLEGQPDGQAIFGIVQGGTDGAAGRERRANRGLDFEGYGIGGLSVGEPREADVRSAASPRSAICPMDQPRYLMGSATRRADRGGGPGDRSVRLRGPHPDGPHGAMLTSHRSSQPPQREHAVDDEPLDPGCRCSPGPLVPPGYLRHLLLVGEPTAWRLLSIHNLSYRAGTDRRGTDRHRGGPIRSRPRPHGGGMGLLRSGLVPAIGKPGLQSDRCARP